MTDASTACDVSPRACPVCQGRSVPFDVVDLNTSCGEVDGKRLPLAGVPVYYFLCDSCNFCHAPQMAAWSLEEFAQRVYNDEYVRVDPDYLEVRPSLNAAALMQLFGGAAPPLRHLDYGGGHGLLSDMLRDSGWDSRSHDPFVDRDVPVRSLGKFDLVTAYEVFEHVPDVRALAADLASVMADDAVVLFTTLVSDGNVHRGKRLEWWYAAPRNGHISLFSRESLGRLGAIEGLQFGSSSPDNHVYWRTKPAWARHFLG
jgi:hypothetical protein